MKHLKPITEKKPKGAPDWHDSDAPDANGRFRDLSPKKLAAWLIKTRKKDVKRISGSLTQQVVFNRNEDPEYAEKMERTRKEVYKQLGRKDLLDRMDEMLDELQSNIKIQESDDADEMAYGQLEKIIDYAHMIRQRLEDGEELDDWMYGKIIKAEDYLNTLADVIDGDDGVIESKVNEKILLIMKDVISKMVGAGFSYRTDPKMRDEIYDAISKVIVPILKDYGYAIKESKESDELAAAINDAIIDIDDSMSYKDFAEAVAKVIKDEYGSHLYKPFQKQIDRSLKESFVVEANTAGEDVWNHIVSITPEEDDIPWGFQDKIEGNNFKLTKVDLKKLLKSDADFKDYYESGEERYDQEEVDEFDVYNELVVVDGELLDGYSRAARLLRQGEKKAHAFIAEAYKNSQTHGYQDKWPSKEKDHKYGKVKIGDATTFIEFLDLIAWSEFEAYYARLIPKDQKKVEKIAKDKGFTEKELKRLAGVKEGQEIIEKLYYELVDDLFYEAKPGPDAYMTGLSDKEKEAKKAKMKKQAEMDDDDPDSYEEMPGDKEARDSGKVKKSKHTTAYHKKFKKESMENIKSFDSFTSEESIDKLEEKFKWETTGDKDDKEFLKGLVQRTKAVYGDIKPAKYDLNDFDKDLDKLLKKFVKGGDSYFKAQDDRNYGTTNKVHGDWMKAAQKVFRHVTTNTAWRGQLNTFTRNLSLLWQIHMEAEAGRTGNRGYKVHKRQDFMKNLKNLQKFESFIGEGKIEEAEQKFKRGDKIEYKQLFGMGSLQDWTTLTGVVAKVKNKRKSPLGNLHPHQEITLQGGAVISPFVHKDIKLAESIINEKKSPYQKADILAGDMFGAMGLFNLTDDELDQIIDLKKADKLAKKQYGEFGFKTLASKEMEELIDSNPKLLREAKRSVVHKAAKKGSYPVTIVVIKDGKVIAQELVKTPEAVPATFNVLQSYHKHRGATIRIESRTGETLFSESLELSIVERFNEYSFSFGSKGQYGIDDVNVAYGFWGTLEMHYDEEQVSIAWEDAFDSLISVYSFSEEGALYYLNSKAGRHLADKFAGGEFYNLEDTMADYANRSQWKKWAKEYNQYAIEENVKEALLIEKIKVASIIDAAEMEMKTPGINTNHLEQIIRRKKENRLYTIESNAEKTLRKLLGKYKIEEAETLAELQKMSKKEWKKTKAFNKHITKAGDKYVMAYDDKIGTYLDPVEIIDEGLFNDKDTENYNDALETAKKYGIPIAVAVATIAAMGLAGAIALFKKGARKVAQWVDRNADAIPESIKAIALEESSTLLIEDEQTTNDQSPLGDEGMETGIKNKAKESGVPVGLLRIIMRRGLAAWKTGHRPGATQAQWGYARVNSFLTKQPGTWGKADSDIAKKVRDGGHDKNL